MEKTMNNSNNNELKTYNSIIYKLGSAEEIADYERYGVKPMTIYKLDDKIKKAKDKKFIKYKDVLVDAFKKYPESMGLGTVSFGLIASMDIGMGTHFLLEPIAGPETTSLIASVFIANAIDKIAKSRWDNKHCPKILEKYKGYHNVKGEIPEYERNHVVGALIGVGAVVIMSICMQSSIMENNLLPITILTSAVMYGAFNIFSGLKKFITKNNN